MVNDWETNSFPPEVHTTPTLRQTFTNTRPYSQPLSPLTVDGERYALPDGFVDCLAFPTSLVMRHGYRVEQWAHLIDGKLMVITNSLILECDVVPNTLGIAPCKWSTNWDRLSRKLKDQRWLENKRIRGGAPDRGDALI